ncbi:hypothetical protein ACPA9J_36115 [Pseudomonas aeruginosa]
MLDFPRRRLVLRDKIQETFYFDIAHQFNEDWSLNATVVNAREKNDYKYLLMAGSINPDNTSTLRGDAYVFDFFSEHWGGDVYVNGRTKVADRQLNSYLGRTIRTWTAAIPSAGGSATYPTGISSTRRSNTNKPSDDDIHSVRRSDDGYASIQKGVYGMGQYYPGPMTCP